ncbi:MAG: hypothetical protein KatS3mg001_139 [Candidatus Pacearchaeota archaeon]|nr:MAG: hypothetical protein KatS3mg001_139 [Candidatus Pacearchaeota archaeon]
MRFKFLFFGVLIGVLSYFFGGDYMLYGLAIAILLVLIGLFTGRKKRFPEAYFGAKSPYDARMMPALTPDKIKEIEKRKRKEAEMIKKQHVMQMRALDKKYGV